MKKIAVVVIAVLVMVASVLTLTACNNSAKDFEYVTKKGTMVIGITDFKPMNYKDTDGKWIGFDTEFAEAVGKELGVKVIFQEIEWDNKEIELNSKAIDCIWNGFTVNDERRENIDFTKSYMMNKQAVIVKASNQDTYTTLESLKAAKIAAEAGSAGQKAIEDDEFLKQAQFVSLSFQTDCLLELLSGTSDAAVIDYVMAKSYIGKGDYASLVIVEDINLAYEEYAIGFRKGSNLDEKVSEVMVKLYNDGTLTMLAEKYEIGVQLLNLAK
jgi:polar amino acid transport system substrate-binding protein